MQNHIKQTASYFKNLISNYSQVCSIASWTILVLFLSTAELNAQNIEMQNSIGKKHNSEKTIDKTQVEEGQKERNAMNATEYLIGDLASLSEKRITKLLESIEENGFSQLIVYLWDQKRIIPTSKQTNVKEGLQNMEKEAKWTLILEVIVPNGNQIDVYVRAELSENQTDEVSAYDISSNYDNFMTEAKHNKANEYGNRKKSEKIVNRMDKVFNKGRLTPERYTKLVTKYDESMRKGFWKESIKEIEAPKISISEEKAPENTVAINSNDSLNHKKEDILSYSSFITDATTSKESNLGNREECRTIVERMTEAFVFNQLSEEFYIELVKDYNDCMWKGVWEKSHTIEEKITGETLLTNDKDSLNAEQEDTLNYDISTDYVEFMRAAMADKANSVGKRDTKECQAIVDSIGKAFNDNELTRELFVKKQDQYKKCVGTDSD